MKVTIRTITKKDLGDVDRLGREFEEYLQSLTKKKRAPYSNGRFLKDGFGRNRKFYGLIARNDGRALGYIFYHYGYDPDEMNGPVLYVIDLFVSESARGLGIGSKLMKSVAKICKKQGGRDVYFGVWVKNKEAIKFYRKLGADFIKDAPFMKWTIC
jgi:ribosomal protein S18 acetylase RimI-like enzyme